MVKDLGKIQEKERKKKISRRWKLSPVQATKSNMKWGMGARPTRFWRETTKSAIHCLVTALGNTKLGFFQQKTPKEASSTHIVDSEKGFSWFGFIFMCLRIFVRYTLWFDRSPGLECELVMWADMWVVGIEPRCCARAAGALNHRAISAAPHVHRLNSFSRFPLGCSHRVGFGPPHISTAAAAMPMNIIISSTAK